MDEFGLESVGVFDLKQFITHLTGIIEHKDCKSKNFSYVYFKPIENSIFNELEDEIKKVFKSECVKKICEANNIKLSLYFYENKVMDGFDKDIKPSLIVG